MWGVGASSSGSVQVNGDLTIGANVQVIPSNLGGSFAGTHTILAWTGTESGTLVLGKDTVNGVIHWTGSGVPSSWSDAGNWDRMGVTGGLITMSGKSFVISNITTGPVTPGTGSDVFIQPSSPTTVNGPSAALTIHSLVLGDGTNATRLALQSNGPLTVTTAATLNNNSTLTGPGTIGAASFSAPSGTAYFDWCHPAGPRDTADFISGSGSLPGRAARGSIPTATRSR